MIFIYPDMEIFKFNIGCSVHEPYEH